MVIAISARRHGFDSPVGQIEPRVGNSLLPLPAMFQEIEGDALSQHHPVYNMSNAMGSCRESNPSLKICYFARGAARSCR